jgi:hypothetical protein
MCEVYTQKTRTFKKKSKSFFKKIRSFFEKITRFFENVLFFTAAKISSAVIFHALCALFIMKTSENTLLYIKPEQPVKKAI